MAAVLLLAACDDRLNPTYAGIRPPAVAAPTGVFDVRQVNGVDLPHTTTAAGTNYSLISGTLRLNADSTWLYSTVEVLSGLNGQMIGTSPANYTGNWRVTDSVVSLLPKYGMFRFRNDSIFWRGGPAHNWEDSLDIVLVKR